MGRSSAKTRRNDQVREPSLQTSAHYDNMHSSRFDSGRLLC
jgi:hypothetical protein